MMAVFMLSLGGLPMTGGFIGKYFLFGGLLQRGKPKARRGTTGWRVGPSSTPSSPFTTTFALSKLCISATRWPMTSHCHFRRHSRRACRLAGRHYLHWYFPSTSDRNCPKTDRTACRAGFICRKVADMNGVLPGQDLIEAGVRIFATAARRSPLCWCHRITPAETNRHRNT